MDFGLHREVCFTRQNGTHVDRLRCEVLDPNYSETVYLWYTHSRHESLKSLKTCSNVVLVQEPRESLYPLIMSVPILMFH